MKYKLLQLLFLILGVCLVSQSQAKEDFPVAIDPSDIVAYPNDEDDSVSSGNNAPADIVAYPNDELED